MHLSIALNSLLLFRTTGMILTSFRCANSRVDISMTRTEESTTYAFSTTSPITLQAQPLFPHATQIHSATFNGRDLDFEIAQHEAGIQVKLGAMLENTGRLVIQHSAELAVIPPQWKTPIGGASTGLRVLTVDQNETGLSIQVEGLVGQDYMLQVMNMGENVKVNGASRSGDYILFTIPEADSSHGVHTVHVRK